MKDYFLIQKYRYGGSIAMEYRIWSEDLYRCLIHRFTLRSPLSRTPCSTESSPKAGRGLIICCRPAQYSRSARRGFTNFHHRQRRGHERRDHEKVLSGDSAPGADFFRKVGIHNVNQRIRYAFGEDYGISIESVEGEYTTMTITLPYRLKEL